MSLPLFIIYLIAIIYEALTKGWLTLLLVPLFVIIIPLSIVMFIITRRRVRTSPNIWLKRSYYLTIASVLIFYVSAVGFGDTEDVFLFGFLSSVESNPLTLISNIIFSGAAFITLASFITWLTVYIRSRRHVNG